MFPRAVPGPAVGTYFGMALALTALYAASVVARRDLGAKLWPLG